MVDAIPRTTSQSPQQDMPSRARKNLSSNYDMFLRLLTAEIKTQNPLNPMDSTKFTQQLATFSALEQQVATNEKLDSVLAQFNSLSVANAAGLIGKSVTAVGNTLTVRPDGASDAKWGYSLGSTAVDVKISVADPKGHIVWSGRGESAMGRHDFAWSGKDLKGNAVPPGDYTLKVLATDANGKAVASSTTVSGKVTAVLSGQGATLLEIGGTKVNRTAVTAITA